jgi:hypothetical protein
VTQSATQSMQYKFTGDPLNPQVNLQSHCMGDSSIAQHKRFPGVAPKALIQ